MSRFIPSGKIHSSSFYPLPLLPQLIHSPFTLLLPTYLPSVGIHHPTPPHSFPKQNQNQNLISNPRLPLPFPSTKHFVYQGSPDGDGPSGIIDSCFLAPFSPFLFLLSGQTRETSSLLYCLLVILILIFGFGFGFVLFCFYY